MSREKRNGFTLLELMIALAVVGAFTALAVPRFSDWSRAQEVKDASRELARAFSTARSEAIRTGNNHIVFLQTDALLNPLTDSTGQRVPILILNDGRAGSANQNCRIDAGEATSTIPGRTGLLWGPRRATLDVPTDVGTGDYTLGSSFTDGAGNDTTWVVFEAQGTPAAFTTACVISGIGSGAGAIYISDGVRDYAAVLNPLGGVRVHGWNVALGGWSN